MGELRNVNRTFVRKPGGKRPVGKTRSKWENSLKV
jgi:hypothetical protein